MIAARGRETPIPNREEARERPGTPVFRPASRPPGASEAGGRETPLPHPNAPGSAGKARERPTRSSSDAASAPDAGLQGGATNTELDPKEAAKPPSPIPNPPGPGKARTRSIRGHTLLPRPEERGKSAEAAKLPSPTTKKRGKAARSAGLQTGIAPHPTSRRGQRPRNSHPQPRRSAGTARSAGLQTGIAAAGRETPIPNSEEARERPGTPVFRPASRPQAAKLPSPTAKKRGKGQERQPPAGIARERETSADDAALGERTYRTPS